MDLNAKYVPQHSSSAFFCPRCNVLAPQRWFNVCNEKEDDEVTLYVFEIDSKQLATRKSINTIVSHLTNTNVTPSWSLELTLCTHCHNYTLWERGIIIYPPKTNLPQPHEEMYENVKEIYFEATNVYNHSPRASAALLRLAIETMIPQLEEYQIKRDSINNMIAELVKKDIPKHIQQGLDSIRIYGNEGIHAGEIFLNEEPETVLFLFELLNIMVDELITKKRKIKDFYDKLPAPKLNGIVNRDRVKN